MDKILVVVVFQFLVVVLVEDSIGEMVVNGTRRSEMPPPSTTPSPTQLFNCKFEKDFCSWTKDTFDDAPWHVTDSVYDIQDAPEGNKFLRLNYNRTKKWGDRGQILSPAFRIPVHSLQVDFWFYVRSPGLYTYTMVKFGLVNNKRVYHWLFGSTTITNGWKPKWTKVSLCIPKVKPNVQLVFFAEAEKGHEVALDDIVVKDSGTHKCKNITLLKPNILHHNKDENKNNQQKAITSINQNMLCSSKKSSIFVDKDHFVSLNVLVIFCLVYCMKK